MEDYDYKDDPECTHLTLDEVVVRKMRAFNEIAEALEKLSAADRVLVLKSLLILYES